MGWYLILIATLILNVVAVIPLVLMIRDRKYIDWLGLIVGFTLMIGSMIVVNGATYLVGSQDLSTSDKIQVTITL